MKLLVLLLVFSFHSLAKDMLWALGVITDEVKRHPLLAHLNNSK